MNHDDHDDVDVQLPLLTCPWHGGYAVWSADGRAQTNPECPTCKRQKDEARSHLDPRLIRELELSLKQAEVINLVLTKLYEAVARKAPQKEPHDSD